MRVASGSSYWFVLASLPHHGDLFSARRPPISRAGLERRLSLLPSADRAELLAIEGLFSWEQAQNHRDDADALAHADHVIAAIRDSRIRALVAERYGMRSVMAALRWRARGSPAPARDGRWGRTPHAFRIARRWGLPSFGLARAEPWIGLAQAGLDAGDALAVERAILGEVWRQLGRAEARFSSGYGAMVIYVLRWAVIERWVRYAAAPAGARLQAWAQTLAHQALAGAPSEARP